MVNEVIKKLEEKGVEYILAKPGEDKPDIMTKDFDIEVETGLKHDIKELENRLVSTNKKIYVMVPNQTEKEKYQNILSNLLMIVSLSDKF